MDFESKTDPNETPHAADVLLSLKLKLYTTLSLQFLSILDSKVLIETLDISLLEQKPPEVKRHVIAEPL